jgi:hypothetical protein
MTIFFPGISRCAICNELLKVGDEVFGTWGPFTADPELFPYCDALIHWSCYAPWPRREAFARAYFEFWVEEERTNSYWAKAYLDDRALMTVNPFNGERGEARLLLSRTGSDVRVDLAEWERWLVAPERSRGKRVHPLVLEELRDVVPALRAAIPTADAAMEALDGESKGWRRITVEDT